MDLLLIFPGFIIAFVIVFYYEYKIKLSRAETRNRVHFYVARDKSGVLNLYLGKPYRNSGSGILADGIRLLTCDSGLKWYGLNKNDYKYLKWRDEPVEVFINMED